jgi:hypothetical protein
MQITDTYIPTEHVDLFMASQGWLDTLDWPERPYQIADKLIMASAWSCQGPLSGHPGVASCSISGGILQTTNQAHGNRIADSFSTHRPNSMTRHPEPENGIWSRMISSIGDLGSEEPRCYICLRTFSRRTRLEAHVNAHLGRKPYKCGGKCGDPKWYAVFVALFLY